MKNILLVFSLLSVTFLFANKRTVVLKGKDAAAKIPNSEIIRMKNFTSVPNYVRFKKGKEIPLANLESWLNQFYASDATYGLKLIKKEVGKLGLSHYRYKQTVSGIPVELSTLIAHVDNGMVLSINGDLFSTINTSVNSSLSEATALSKALNFINAETYKWELPQEEAHLKIEQDDDNATYYPKGKQVLINRGGTVYGEMKLAYKFNIYAQKPFSRREIYIDASSGEILWEETKIHHADVVGSATTAYSGVRTITTDNTGGTFRLREAGRGNGIETYDANGNNRFNLVSSVDFTDTDNNWNNVNADLDQYATDAHWGAEMTYDYFLNEHGRNSIDGVGFKLISHVHVDVGGSQINAVFDGQRMLYGDGSGGITPLTTIDIAGHEVAHGLTDRTAGLIYQDESGALNESFSDIFGVSIDAFARPGIANWQIGEEIGTPLRSMSNPNAFNDPDTYFGTNWAPLGAAERDFGGVHTNSSVQNYWFFLISNGGSGTNDNNNSYAVNSIGFTTAGSIAFRNLTVYLTRSSDYSDARFFAIQSAEDLFGQCSDEVKEVTNAWYAVGVGSEHVPINVISDFDASGLTSCAAPFTVNFNNLSVNGINYTWNFGDGNSSAQGNPSHTYTSNGTYTVELVADGGSSCGADTETKTAYISVNTPSRPAITNATICENDVANLGATGSGVLNWYSAPSGGSAIANGGSYLTPPLSATTTYYVEDVNVSSSQPMGKTDNSGGGANFNFPHYLIFDVYEEMELVSVVVYAGVSGSRTIELRNSAGAVLQSRTVNIPVGTQTVNLNFNIPSGTDYQLGVSNGSTIDMYRNAFGGVNYPYTLGGVASVKQSNVGLNHYYFFYDWQIKLEDCVSSRTAVTANVNPDPVIVANTSVNTICAGDPIALSGSGGVSYSWDNGVIDGVPFVPSLTRTYIVTGTDRHDCENTDQVTVNVSSVPFILANVTDDTICSGDPVTLNGAGGVSYLWNNSVLNGISFMPTFTDTYIVTGTGANGCENTDQVTVVVNTCTGLTEITHAPNINSFITLSDDLKLDINNFEKGNYSLVVVNSLGQVIISEQINVTSTAQREVVNMKTNAKGVYYVSLFNSFNHYTNKIVN